MTQDEKQGTAVHASEETDVCERRCPRTEAKEMRVTTQSSKSDRRKSSNSCVNHARNNQCTIFLKRRCPMVSQTTGSNKVCVRGGHEVNRDGCKNRYSHPALVPWGCGAGGSRPSAQAMCPMFITVLSQNMCRTCFVLCGVFSIKVLVHTSAWARKKMLTTRP